MQYIYFWCDKQWLATVCYYRQWYKISIKSLLPVDSEAGDSNISEISFHSDNIAGGSLRGGHMSIFAFSMVEMEK